MYFEELKNFKFYLSLGYVVVISSLITIIIVELIKLILRKRKVITDEMNANKKDVLLTYIGRIVSLVVYICTYIINEIILKNQIIVNESLFVGLLSGGAMTLTVAKGLYTSYRQIQKKNNALSKIETEKNISSIQNDCIKKQKIILKKKESE